MRGDSQNESGIVGCVRHPRKPFERQRAYESRFVIAGKAIEHVTDKAQAAVGIAAIEKLVGLVDDLPRRHIRMRWTGFQLAGLAICGP